MEDPLMEVWNYWKGNWSEKLIFLFVLCSLGFAAFLIIDTAFSRYRIILIPVLGSLAFSYLIADHYNKRVRSWSTLLPISESEVREKEEERIIGKLPKRWIPCLLIFFLMPISLFSIVTFGDDIRFAGSFVLLFFFLVLVMIYIMTVKVIDLGSTGLTVRYSLPFVPYSTTAIDAETVVWIIVNRRIRLAVDRKQLWPKRIANIEVRLKPEVRISTVSFDGDHFSEEQLERIVEHLLTIRGFKGKIEEQVTIHNY